MYELRLIKSFKALEVKNNSIKVASHSQHSKRVKKLAPFSKYRTKPENSTNTSKLVFCSNLLPVGNWQGIQPKHNLILQLSPNVRHREGMGGDETRHSPKMISLQRKDAPRWEKPLPTSFEPFPVPRGSWTDTNEEPAMEGVTALKLAVRSAWGPQDHVGTALRSHQVKVVHGKSQSPWRVMGWVSRAEMRKRVEVHGESGGAWGFPVSCWVEAATSGPGPAGGHTTWRI